MKKIIIINVLNILAWLGLALILENYGIEIVKYIFIPVSLVMQITANIYIRKKKKEEERK
ncbi:MULTISPECIES: hypothetical protein [unclassified Gemella]|uniref:hypothetical protein n=1 Tax=unclassified Gemella TaxID=2624949 RepID=UPI001C04E2DD|nr:MULTISPECIES: hypothetical protein [unclassified Gemella]MBU0279384.1 hypothetical protein [Gemella sp. zg-1178]QWQ38906.1 hypothetical protein KMP11_00620 [Gemella sp. zg-570]